MLPAIHAEVFYTTSGKTPYLKEPGVVMLSAPITDLSSVQPFIDGFDNSLEFGDYLKDDYELPPAEQLCKFAGQLCYMSFGPKRSWNKDCDKYLEHIKASGHGSLCEHANFSFLFYGISRSCTHELVRHRAGCAFSQVSQRYVDGKKLRFVERPEYADDKLHISFEDWIDVCEAEYVEKASRLLSLQHEGWLSLDAERKTDLKKKVNQAARSVLPNETEAPIVMTANARAWRHVLEMRASEFAETEIRRLAMRVYECLIKVAPLLFNDYTVVTLKDGTQALDTKYRKV